MLWEGDQENCDQAALTVLEENKIVRRAFSSWKSSGSQLPLTIMTSTILRRLCNATQD